jgi:hypothetical protein
VATVSGIAATIEPSAYSVTSCPASTSLTPSPAPICGSSPAGRVSVRMAMKPVMAKASNAA